LGECGAVRINLRLLSANLLLAARKACDFELGFELTYMCFGARGLRTGVVELALGYAAGAVLFFVAQPLQAQPLGISACLCELSGGNLNFRTPLAGQHIRELRLRGLELLPGLPDRVGFILGLEGEQQRTGADRLPPLNREIKQLTCLRRRHIDELTLDISLVHIARTR
jgi:hypothetical protein